MFCTAVQNLVQAVKMVDGKHGGPYEKEGVLMSDSPPTQETTMFEAHGKALYNVISPGIYYNNLLVKRPYHMYVADSACTFG